MGRRNRDGKYVVSRQQSYPDGIYYVELETGGEDSTSPGMLAGKGYGEGTFSDPREAAQNLIDVRNAWQADFNLLTSLEVEPQTVILVSIGTTGGGMFSHEPEAMTDEAIIAWGDHEYENIPKCDRCGEMRVETYSIDSDPDAEFCSENCANIVFHEIEEANETVVIEYKYDYQWWQADDNGWVDDPDDATHYFRSDVTDDIKAIGEVVTLEDATESFERYVMTDMPDPPTPL